MSSHHVFFKSQYYKKDRDKGWNRVDLDEDTHRILHHAGTDAELEHKARLDYLLKYGAYKKYLKRENQVGLKDIEYELRKSKYKLKKYEDNT
jgi:hypothetical protein